MESHKLRWKSIVIILITIFPSCMLNAWNVSMSTIAAENAIETQSMSNAKIMQKTLK